jgi:rhamnose utilization protein RhaD (predicted bifunctional aldolase and dehydrogenase)/NAD(P)-dependent dehydrogenase (short-subunit alcohol dehydrogenase family)
VQSLWNENEAAQYAADLDLRAYSSRLLGQNADLVLHGGGNTSVKVAVPNIYGEPQDILYIKGSGWDLATIETKGFAPARLADLRRLSTLDALSDVQMANELRCSLIDASAPSPSVEAILHAIIPHRFVDHTHADAILTLTNNPNRQEHVRKAFGDDVVVIPYVMPGFLLAKLCAEEFPRQYRDEMQGMILMNHGIFTFGETARESYERMIALVTRAEDYLAQFGKQAALKVQPPPDAMLREEVAQFRQQVSRVAGKPMLVSVHQDAEAWKFVQHPNLAERALQSPVTPDNVIRTKRLPMIGQDVEAYAKQYQAYFEEHAAGSKQPLTMLDPAPRVALVPEWGVVTIGQSAKDMSVTEEVYRHAMRVIKQSEALGGYVGLPAEDIFQVEYWDLEQVKLKMNRASLPFTGEVALVTGGASGIGKACVDALLARGAAVVSLDIQAPDNNMKPRPDYYAIQCDITDEEQLADALEKTVRKFGGLDMVVLNAGIFPSGTPIAKLPLANWEKVMQVNLNANLSLLRLCHPLLKASPRSGRVVVVASKNVPAPGPGAAAYSASKAALTQLARVAALEWGSDQIRINIVHPNAVFDTALWTEDILEARAKHYGMSVEAYKTNNVLKVEITSKDVGELVATMCDAPFSRTTGAQVPIDGGNDRVI